MIVGAASWRQLYRWIVVSLSDAIVGLRKS